MAAKVHLSYMSADRRRDSSGLLLGKQISVQLSRAKGTFPPSVPPANDSAAVECHLVRRSTLNSKAAPQCGGAAGDALLALLHSISTRWRCSL